MAGLSQVKVRVEPEKDVVGRKLAKKRKTNKNGLFLWRSTLILLRLLRLVSRALMFIFSLKVMWVIHGLKMSIIQRFC